MNTPNTAMDASLQAAVRKAQADEEAGAVLYGFMAARQKDENNRRCLAQMSHDEKMHAQTWKALTKEEIKPGGAYIGWMKFLTVVFGFTFVIKRMEKDEQIGQDTYARMSVQLPQAAVMLKDEKRHEDQLEGMLDEERLHYVGSIVLGLNDALVELTGAIAGVTFALADTKLVAMTGIITGISATLSMAASNYLAQRADGSSDALKSSVYTGIAYLITVVLLVLPYLLLPSPMYLTAFVLMLATVLLIIAGFNYYISVTKEENFWKRFAEMASISMGVAALSFLIGILAKQLLGIDTL